MDTNFLLYISLILYVAIMILGFVFNIKWLFLIGGMIWLIPVIEVDNFIVRIVCIAVLVFHGFMGIEIKRGDDFE